MNFIRKSLTNKAVFLFSITFIITLVIGITLYRLSYVSIQLGAVIGIAIILPALFLGLFIWNVVSPIRQLTQQVRNLLTGNRYKRIPPTTVDEVGVLTHFFNEITHDLEKISYDIKERRRMSSELDIASQIQKDVLPKEAPKAPGLDIVAKTRSAAEVGGDNFDFLESSDENQIFIYIGDVTGHGVPAGLIMVMVDTLFTALVSQGINKGQELIAQVNALLTPRISSKLFMTAVMLRWDKNEQKMYYTGAGHEHILVYHQNTEAVDAIRSGGIALGMVPDVSKIVKEQEIPLEVGDSIVLYSDGITEAKNQTGEMYTVEKLTDSFKKHGYLPSSSSIFDHLTQDFSDFVGEYVQVDDITMIVIKYLGKDASDTKTELSLSLDESKKEQVSKKWNWVG